ncbi:MAG: phosphoribosylaminoimidazolesuccinocarboxamide synthase [Bdellovibrionota bacterium]|nr:MAG: phosphoribosylaminoimidazolesuccinocarboxamide synthase [Pseudomonadota bacterium]
MTKTRTIREYLKEIGTSKTPEKTLKEHAYTGLSERERDQRASEGLTVYAGKVRELVGVADELFIFHTDRLSAFDRFVGMVPYKGVILADLSEYWLKAAKAVVPTHYIDRPQERVLRCKACTPFKVEVIVRGYMAGSMARAYEKGVREFCGAKLGEGLQNYRALPEAIITPTTKAAAYEHDEDISPKELIERGVVTKDDWQTIETMALKLFAFGQKVYAEKGWILVDTKYEFGRDKSGEICVIDEIHTPDSSRLWVRETYEKRLSAGDAPEMLDKETVRRYLMSQGFSGQGDVPYVPVANIVELAETYLTVAETLRGQPLTTTGPSHEIGSVVDR